MIFESQPCCIKHGCDIIILKALKNS